MKKVIGRKIYNTDAAEELARYSHGYAGDFHAYAETLYRTKRGSLFLYGEGGPLTSYAVSLGGGSWSGGKDIRPLTLGEALDWCEKHNEIDVMRDLAPDAITEA